MKYAILTFGCRVNQADSFEIEAALRASKAEPSTPEAADLVVVNTCSVTAAADQGARHAIRRVRRLNPGARIIATGCYATREPEALTSLPGVVRLVPNADKPSFSHLLREELGAAPGAALGAGQDDGPDACGAWLTPGALNRTAATLRVQTGCDESCSYCIIPTTRGRPTSRPLASVLTEFRTLLDSGYTEVVVTGVHLGSYGRDLEPESSLVALLRALAQEACGRAPEPLVRVSSVEPMDCSDEVLEVMASSGIFAAHLHLPLQHASDPVLARMRRPYTAADFERLARLVRQRMPHAAIGSDVMVGFPGETDADVDCLLAFLEHSPLTHLHVFPYSERPGTEAAGLRPKVDSAEAKDRASRVREVSDRLHARFVASQQGQIRRGLVLRSGTQVMTDNYLTVPIQTPRPRNERVRVRIASINPIQGEVLE